MFSIYGQDIQLDFSLFSRSMWYKKQFLFSEECNITVQWKYIKGELREQDPCFKF